MLQCNNTSINFIIEDLKRERQIACVHNGIKVNSLAQNVAVKVECNAHTRQLTHAKQGSYNFMWWVCDKVKLFQVIINNNSNDKQLI